MQLYLLIGGKFDAPILFRARDDEDATQFVEKYYGPYRPLSLHRLTEVASWKE